MKPEYPFREVVVTPITMDAADYYWYRRGDELPEPETMD